MQQHNLKPPVGSTRKRKRVGRGDGSGHGSYSGKGCKGQKSRAGGGVRLGFEGGQLPLVKRLPRKRGFVNLFKTEYCLVKVGELNSFSANSEISPKELFEKGLINSFKYPVKILGDGDIDRPLVVKANKFSVAAQKKITAAGGKVEAI
jgi:large subunit ribosomal protein L15